MATFKVEPFIITLSPSGVYFENNGQAAKPGDKIIVSDITAGNIRIVGELYRIVVEGDGAIVTAKSFDGLQSIDVKLYKPAWGQTTYELKMDEKNVSIRNIRLDAQSSSTPQGFSWTMILLFIVVVILALGGYFVYPKLSAAKTV